MYQPKTHGFSVQGSSPASPATGSPVLRLLRNFGAGLVGLVAALLAIAAVTAAGGALIPPLASVDASDWKSINAHIREYSFAQLMVPFCAHAAGPLVGAYFGALIAASHKLVVAFSIGALFLIAGSYMVYLISSSPLWFSALDLCVAYLPMSWLGWRLATASKRA